MRHPVSSPRSLEMAGEPLAWGRLGSRRRARSWILGPLWSSFFAARWSEPSGGRVGSQEQGTRPPMSRRIVGLAVLPTTPQHAQPGTTQDADRVRMIAAAIPSPTVDLCRPERGVARVVGEAGHGPTQALVAGPAIADAAVLARFIGDGRDAGLGGELVGMGEAGAIVAELGEDLGGVDAPGTWEGHDDRTIRMLCHGMLETRGEQLELGHERFEERRKGEYEFPLGLAIGGSGQACRCRAQAIEQLGRRAAATVRLASE